MFWRAITFIGAASVLAPHFVPAWLVGGSFVRTLWIAALGPVLLAVVGVRAVVHARATADDPVLSVGALLVATVLACAALVIPVWVADLVWFYVVGIIMVPFHVVSLAIFIVGSIAVHRAHRLAGIDSPRAFLPFVVGLGSALCAVVLGVTLRNQAALTAGVAIKGFAPDGTELALEGSRTPPGLTLDDIASWYRSEQMLRDQPVLAGAPGEAAVYVALKVASDGSVDRSTPELQRLALDDSRHGGWRRSLGTGQSGAARAATVVAAAPAGGVFTLGVTNGAGRMEGWWMKLFEADGTERANWDQEFPCDAPMNRPYGVVVDRAGAVYVFGETGSHLDVAIGTSAWIRKFDAEGHELLAGWNKRIKRGGPGRPSTAAVSAATGADGELYVLLDTYHLLSLHKFDSDGEEIREGWQKEMPDAERVLALASDSAGGVFLFGQVRDLAAPDVPYRGWIQRFHPDGSVAPGWDKTFDSPGHVSDVAAVAFDPAGGIYFGGYATASDQKATQWWIRKFRADGSPSPGWDKTLGEVGTNRVFALVTGRGGELYAIGEGHGYIFTGSLVERWWGD